MIPLAHKIRSYINLYSRETLSHVVVGILTLKDIYNIQYYV